jgi:protein-disulfide isomerase
MRKVTIIAAATLALALAGCGKKDESAAAPASTETAAAPAAATPAPAGQDWTTTVSATPEGGFRMGNPNAPVKLVEYASLTCPHCAAFANESEDKLLPYVKKGTVSWEFRTFILNPIDLSASLLARCQGPEPFFKLVEQTYADQQSWVSKYQNLTPADSERIGKLPETQQFAEIAKLGGLDQFFRARGLPEAKAQACLADKTAIDALVALRDHGTQKDGVTGTPSFLINGKLAEETYGWEALEPKLKAAGA